MEELEEQVGMMVDIYEKELSSQNAIYLVGHLAELVIERSIDHQCRHTAVLPSIKISSEPLSEAVCYSHFS